MLKRMSRRMIVALGAAVALAGAASIFVWVERSRVAKAPPPPAAEASHALAPEQLAKLADQLEARLAQSPDDAAGWVMLARSRITLARFDAAAEAYARAARLRPNDVDLLADYADALAMARGRKLEGEPHEIIRRALAIDPAHVKSLALAGSAEFEAKRYAAAVAYWERIVPMLSAESDFGRSIRRNIAQARDLGRLPPGGAGISGTVRLAPALASRTAPGDALFVFARAAQGARTPLAVVRATAGDLPYAFRFDDSQAMNPNARLSGQSSLIVIAHISKTGTAIAKPGDLEGRTKPIAPGATQVELVIDQVRQ